jgi:hypothetical protein
MSVHGTKVPIWDIRYEVGYRGERGPMLKWTQSTPNDELGHRCSALL